MRRILIILVGFLCSCNNGPVLSSYRAVLPDLPPLWYEMLGEPNWRLEWVDSGGNWSVLENLPHNNDTPSLSIDTEWTVPVIASPYWQEKGIPPGVFRPCGALFPWDVDGGNIILQWEKGVDVFLWQKLAENNYRQSEKGTPRFPWYFDWLRFRELFETDDFPDGVKLDPWSADWELIAQKTAESGFDKRRIKPEAKKEISIPCPAGLWIGSSPFVSPVESIPGKPTGFSAGAKPETWFSRSGMIKIQNESWVFTAWETQ